MRCCARFRRAPATIFIARVIFCVLLTLVMRLRIALRLATNCSGRRQPARSGLFGAGNEALAELLQRFIQLLLEVVADFTLVTDLFPDIRVLLVDVTVE